MQLTPREKDKFAHRHGGHRGAQTLGTRRVAQSP